MSRPSFSRAPEPAICTLHSVLKLPLTRSLNPKRLPRRGADGALRLAVRAPDGRTFDFFGGCGWATNADRARVSEDPYLSLLVCYAAANHARSFR